MLIVTGHIQVEPPELACFHAEVQGLAILARRRRGNLSYDVAVADPVAGRLLVSERWFDQAALTAHMRARQTVAFVQRWQGRMRAEVRKYDASNERGLLDY